MPSVIAISPDRASDTADLLPLGCDLCPYVGELAAATWQIEYTLMVGSEPCGERMHVCNTCLAPAHRRVLEHHQDLVPPVVSELPKGAVAA